MSALASIDGPDVRPRRAVLLEALRRGFADEERTAGRRVEARGVAVLPASDDAGAGMATAIEDRRPSTRKTAYSRKSDPDGRAQFGPMPKSVSVRAIAFDLDDIIAGRARMSGMSIVRTLLRTLPPADIALVLDADVRAVAMLMRNPLFRVASIVRPEVGTALTDLLAGSRTRFEAGDQDVTSGIFDRTI